MIGPVCGPLGFCGLALSLCVTQAKPGCAVTDHLRRVTLSQTDGWSAPTPCESTRLEKNQSKRCHTPGAGQGRGAVELAQAAQQRPVRETLVLRCM